MLIIAVIVSIIVAVGAARLGYSGILWFFAFLFGGAFTLGLIAALPDRKLAQKRESELADLQRELAAVTPLPPFRSVTRGDVLPETIGNRDTIREG